MSRTLFDLSDDELAAAVLSRFPAEASSREIEEATGVGYRTILRWREDPPKTTM